MIGSSETKGYVEFEDNDGNTMRYEIGAGNLVQFGPVGSLSELAGPVSQLQFTCYDACDLDTAITDVNLVRSVKARATLTNSAALGRDQTFTAQAYLRTNSLGGGGGARAGLFRRRNVLGARYRRRGILGRCDGPAIRTAVDWRQH